MPVGWVPTTCQGLTFLGGSRAQSQLAWVRGRGQQGWWQSRGEEPRRRRRTGAALGGSGFAVDLDHVWVRCPGAPEVWGRDRRLRRRQRSEEKTQNRLQILASRFLPVWPWSRFLMNSRAIQGRPRLPTEGLPRPASGLGVSWQDAGRGWAFCAGRGAVSPLVAHRAVAVVPVSGSFSHQPRPWGMPCPGGLVGRMLWPVRLPGCCSPPTVQATHEPLGDTLSVRPAPRRGCLPRPSKPRPPTRGPINIRD